MDKGLGMVRFLTAGVLKGGQGYAAQMGVFNASLSILLLS